MRSLFRSSEASAAASTAMSAAPSLRAPGSCVRTTGIQSLAKNQQEDLGAMDISQQEVGILGKIHWRPYHYVEGVPHQDSCCQGGEDTGDSMRSRLLGQRHQVSTHISRRLCGDSRKIKSAFQPHSPSQNLHDLKRHSWQPKPYHFTLSQSEKDFRQTKSHANISQRHRDRSAVDGQV